VTNNPQRGCVHDHVTRGVTTTSGDGDCVSKILGDKKDSIVGDKYQRITHVIIHCVKKTCFVELELSDNFGTIIKRLTLL